LILGKIIEIVAIRCQILKLKYWVHQIRFELRLCLRPCWGSLQDSPDPIAGGEEGRDGRKREGKRGRESREGRVYARLFCLHRGGV